MFSLIEKLTSKSLQVFSCRHNQHWKAACLISLAFLLISVKNGQDDPEDSKFANIFAISVVWTLLRLFGILDNSVDDLDIFSKYTRTMNYDF